MIPVKDSIKINFAGGLNLKDDPWQVPPNEFSALNNMVFTTGGRLTKRNGFGSSSFTKTVNSPNPSLTFSKVPGTLTEGRKTFAYRDELCLLDGFSLYSYDSGNLAWNYKGRQTCVDLSTLPIYQSNVTYAAADMSIDSTSGVKVFAFEDSGAAITRYSIVDSTTGQVILNGAEFNGATGYLAPRCLSVSGKSWVFAIDTNLGATNLVYQAIVGQTVTGSVTTLVALNATNSIYDIDVDPNTGNIYLAYNNAAGSIVIALLDTSLNVTASITKAETASNGLSWFGDGTNIWVAYNTSAATKAFIVNNAVTSTTTAPFVIDATANAANVNNVTGVWSSTFSKAFIFFDPTTITGSIASSAKIYYGTAGVNGASPAGGVLFIADLSINSKAWAVSGVPTIVGLYTRAGALQPTNFLLNLYNVTSTMGTTDITANLAGKISPDEAGQTAPHGKKVGNYFSLHGVHQNGNYWETALLYNNNFGFSSSNQYSANLAPTGVVEARFDFTVANQDEISLGNNAIMAGAAVNMYDGAQTCEDNFHIYPYTVGASTATGGGGSHLTAGTYGYIATYEWLDNQGQVHRSFPSPVTSVVYAGGVTDGVTTLTIPTLRVTNKPGTQVVINIYRTIVNGSVYFLLGNYGTVINDPTAATVTFIDSKADSLIISNIQLYTTGALGYYAPPATSALTSYKNRAINVASEDPYQFGYSNQVLPNFPAQFVPFFLQNIGSIGGPIKTASFMDDKLILFKDGKQTGPSVYYVSGQGPAPSGAGNDFQDPQPITVDAGCVDRTSVVLTPLGLMYKSDKGIYLIDRSLQASYIGAAVESYNQYTVLSSQLIPNSTQVRFWLSNGTLLMYDYFYKQWASWTPPAGVSDCIYQGQHTYVSSSGQVYQETPGTYVDGTATAVLWSFVTSWVKLSGLQGYQRAYFLFLIGQYISSHKLSVSLYTDFSTTPDSSVTITPDSTDSLENWRVFFTKQRCQSFQVAVSEVSTGVLGQGCTLSGLNLIAGVKQKFRTISAAQSTS